MLNDDIPPQCDTKGAKLASLHSHAEQHIVTESIRNQSMWIGLIKVGSGESS